jgi:uncharacterized protein involved in outer membrane biogenesis
VCFIFNFILLEDPVHIPEKKPFSLFRFLIKTVSWSAGIALLLGLTAVLLILVYENEVKSAIIGELNKNLRSEVTVDPENIDLTFVKSFPKCALEFKDVLILEAIEKKERDTLIFAANVLLMFDLEDLWNKNYTIHKIEVQKAKCNLRIDKKGSPNYIFWKSPESKTGDDLKFALEKISFTDIDLGYKNAKEKIRLSMQFSEASFSGKFGNEVYNMASSGKARLEFLQMNKVNVLKQKNVRYDVELNINN